MVYNRPTLNYQGQEWASLKGWLEEELQDTYKRLANPAATEVQTQQARGRASLISQMLDFSSIPAAGKPQN